MTRCAWAESSEAMRDYHDKEWGVPVHDNQKLFEFLILEGAQAGLSWSTVLNKRATYRRVFHDFDIARVAAMTDEELETALQNPGIIRNKLKVYGARKNALAAQQIIATHGSLSKYLWQFVDGKSIDEHRVSMSDLPGTSPASDAMSKTLKKAGFTFVGSTICYSFLQAVGMINDHVIDCFRYKEVQQ